MTYYYVKQFETPKAACLGDVIKLGIDRGAFIVKEIFNAGTTVTHYGYVSFDDETKIFLVGHENLESLIKEKFPDAKKLTSEGYVPV